MESLIGCLSKVHGNSLVEISHGVSAKGDPRTTTSHVATEQTHLAGKNPNGLVHSNPTEVIDVVKQNWSDQ